MTAFLFVRHAAHVLGGDIIVGSLPGVHLSDAGRDQARRLAERLAGVAVHAIYSSPLARARQTAHVLSDRFGVEVEISEAFQEIDYGDWVGRHLDELRPLDGWNRWNSCRGTARVPNGESMAQVQARAIGAIEDLHRRHADRNVVVVTHRDVITAALCHYLGVPLDLCPRIEIGPASVSVLRLLEDGAVLGCLNASGSPAWPGLAPPSSGAQQTR